MDDEFDPASSAGSAPLDEVKQSVHSDLQYVSLQVDGRTYGGWYRVLADGQMELLALANMHSERRFERTPVEQARGMLADFIRVARPKPKTEGSTAARADDEGTDEDCLNGTLGALLYADRTKTRVSEQDWAELVQSIAAGNSLALRELYQRTHRIVFTLIARLTDDRETAEELTLDVFHDMWRRAPECDAIGGSVLGWIMNQARSSATDPLAVEKGGKRADPRTDSPLPRNVASGSDEVIDLQEPVDELCPSQALWGRLAERIAADRGGGPVSPAIPQWTEPEWEEVAPGISCKLLATDADKHRISMLVRLAPGIEYPPHTHAGVEELHLLHGELLIDDRKLHPGDYNRAEPRSADKRVWSETGCTCVLITSTQDVIG